MPFTIVSDTALSEDATYLHGGIDGAPQEDLPARVQKYSLASLYMIVLYWTANVLLHDVLSTLPQSAAYINLAEEGFVDSGMIDSMPFSSCIARSIQYFVHQDAGLSAAVSMAFPVHVVAESIAAQAHLNLSVDHNIRSQEIQAILQNIKNTPGGKWIHPLVEESRFSSFSTMIVDDSSEQINVT